MIFLQMVKLIGQTPNLDIDDFQCINIANEEPNWQNLYLQSFLHAMQKPEDFDFRIKLTHEEETVQKAIEVITNETYTTGLKSVLTKLYQSGFLKQPDE